MQWCHSTPEIRWLVYSSTTKQLPFHPKSSVPVVQLRLRLDHAALLHWQQVRSKHKFPHPTLHCCSSSGLIRLLPFASGSLASLPVLFPVESPLDTLWNDCTSGCIVTEWTPYAWKHSLIVDESPSKSRTISPSRTICTDARVFVWFRRQMCSSWTARTPGIFE